MIILLICLEKEIATHSSILAWKIPWTEEPGGLQVQGVAESDTTQRLHFTSLICYKQCLDHMIIKADCCLCMKNCILICYRWLCQLPTTSH